jgi:ethanolamine ammonia-lyase small subunit
MTRRAGPPQRNAKDEGLWARLRQLTAARIGLPRSGASLSTSALLDFQLAHARARDAVWEDLDEAKLKADLAELGLAVLSVGSGASDRQSYLMRPDLGRRLAPDALKVLSPRATSFDVVFVISGGLSARAVQAHASPLLTRVLVPLRDDGWRVAPLIIVRHGRVAVGDAIAGILRASCAVVLIGERPGLSAPDSMGAYLTWEPTAQTSDADRNCVSNIRPGGLSYAAAASTLVRLLLAIRQRRISGVRLKDEADPPLRGPSG